MKCGYRVDSSGYKMIVFGHGRLSWVVGGIRESCLRPRQLAWNTWRDCVGRMGLCAHSVGQIERGGRAEGCGVVNNVACRLP